MRKIPTLFVRDPDDRRHVLNEVTPGCEWVLAGEGLPTRKYDGTCVLIRRDGMVARAFARREVKPGGACPEHFTAVETDEVTGKVVGWEPAEQSGFRQFIDEALEHFNGAPGTYELVGPKINKNPEGREHHELVEHATALIIAGFPRTFEGIKAEFTDPEWPGWEGVVFHHPDGRMAKIKMRDFV